MSSVLAPLVLLIAIGPSAGDLAVKPGSPEWKRAHPGPRRRPAPAGRQAAPAVSLVNLHTNEILPVLPGQRPSPARVNRFLRCRFTERETQMAPALMGWVLETAAHFRATEVQFVSAYRSPKLNEMLRKKGREVARESNHRLGRAVDFRLLGVDTSALVRFLRGRRWGGVGRYPDSGFVHLDNGPVRTWGGR
jgi:hypothetical protein